MEKSMTNMTDAEKLKYWFGRIPEKYRGTWLKAMEGHSRQKAILAKCQDCMNWQIAEVRKCDIITCPLHPYRVVHRSDSTQTNALGEGEGE